MTNTNIENAKAYLLENKEELRQIVSELNSWNGSLEYLQTHEFDEDFFDTFFDGRPYEAARATHFGKLNWSDDYIRFNGYGNLESLSDYDLDKELEENIDEIAELMIENRSNIYLESELEEILDEDEAEDEE